MKNLLLHILSAFIFLFLPSVNFAQAPNLGTAANFVLFTTTGAVTNTGASQLTGNVGTNSGSSTGFGNVNGGMHDNDGVSAQCAADLMIAYNTLNTATPTFFPAAALGNGQTFTEGVYKISSPATLDSTLFLNAQGNANAVFIFQIEGAFSINSGVRVRLVNGAQACNVFWKTEGLVSMASHIYMRGTIVAHNAAININANDSIEGRALSTAGAITVNHLVAYTPTGCGSAVLTGPAAPDLASTACYALFSGSGSVANSGITYVTGDIGTNVGLTTGYNSANVTGTIHTIPDGSTAACAADLLNVYNYLNTLPDDIELLYPAQFGSNLVLTPHTYIMKGAAALTDTLYLNAEGNSNAVFVIKVNGALSTTTNAKIILLKKAQAGNVYWKIDGATSLNDNTIFKGTIVCNNGAVSLKTGTALEGRAFTTNGAFSTAAINATMPPGCKTLPVTWLSFTAEKDPESEVKLKWSTANEINNGHFEVQRSSDGTHFTKLGSVPALDNSNSVQSYSYTDVKTINGNNFYRLKQVDLDGNFKYSAIVKANMTGALWVLFPNPATSKITIQIRSQLKNVSFTLLDNNGKIVYHQSLASVNAGEYKDIPLANFTRGIYMLKIVSDEGSRTDKIIVQ